MNTDKLEKLHSLLQSGAISQKEFNDEKAKILSNEKQKSKKEQKDNCFDKSGKDHKDKYDITIGIPSIFAILDLIGILGLLFLPKEIVSKYAIIFAIIFGLCIVFDYFFLKTVLSERISKLTSNFIISCCLLLIPIVGFIPARHLWIYTREKELLSDYKNYQQSHPKEEKQESTITTSAWKTSLIFGESFALIKLLEFLAYV